jgi:dUTP pyrophosphatase
VNKIELRVMRLPHAADLPLPAYQSELAAGIDLVAAVPSDAPVTIAPGQRAAIPTGIAIALPPGVEGQIRPRSGLALRHGITVLNLGAELFSVERGARIAQLVFASTLQATICEVANLDETSRGVGGFGSTGTRGGKS